MDQLKGFLLAAMDVGAECDDTSILPPGFDRFFVKDGVGVAVLGDRHYQVELNLTEVSADLVALPPAFETQKMFVCSTAHVTKDTASNFDLLTDDVPEVFYPKTSPSDGVSYGWFIPIGEEIHWSHMVTDDLKAIRKLAESQGCTWIMLDRDGETYEELETYEW